MGISERRQRERKKRRKEIIDAAERVVFSEGFEHATMDAVAQEAELSKATIYLYFKSKEDLYFAIFMRGQELLFNMVDESLQRLRSTQKKLEAFLKTVVSFQEKHPDYFNAFYYFLTHRMEISEDSEDWQKNRELDQIYLGKWMDLVKRGKDEGLIRQGLKAVDSVLLIWMQLIGFLKIYSEIQPDLERQFSVTRDSMLKQYFALIFNGILNKQ